MSDKIAVSQAQIFCAKWLPSLFHHTPGQFLNLLERDGTKFLRFYWDLAGKDLPPELLRDPFGLNYAFRKPAEMTFVTLVSLPEPQTIGETYFMALIYRPYRRIILVSDMTKVIGLEKTEPAGPESPATVLVEITRHIQRMVLPGEQVEPRLEKFYQAALRQLD